MANKKSSISINALERYCKKASLSMIKKKIEVDNENSLEFEIKPHLSLAECLQFVEDVVSESIMADDLSIVPIAREFITNRSLLTYYSNFTMPADIHKTFELVAGAKEIVAIILENIDISQFEMIQRAICERIAFEKEKMIAVQELKVNKTISEMSQFVSRMAGLFDGVNGEQMAKFVSGMSESPSITAQDLAAAMVNSTIESV